MDEKGDRQSRNILPLLYHEESPSFVSPKYRESRNPLFCLSGTWRECHDITLVPYLGN